MIAAELNREKYRELATKNVLLELSNIGLSSNVVPNLRKLGFSDSEIKIELLLTVEKQMGKPSEDEFANSTLILPLKEV